MPAARMLAATRTLCSVLTLLPWCLSVVGADVAPAVSAAFAFSRISPGATPLKRTNVRGAFVVPHVSPLRMPCRIAAGLSPLPIAMQGWGGGGDWGPDNNLGRNRPGDWECPECGAAVFGSKDACYRCSCPKPENPRPAANRQRDRGDRDRRGGRFDRPGRERGRGRNMRDMGPWARAEDDGTEVDEGVILNYLQTRDDARAGRDFATADDIRGILAEDFSIFVDDDVREWWVGEPRAREKGQGDRGAGPWARAPGDEADVDEAAVLSLIAQRDAARTERDFATADEVRDALQMDFGVAVDDGLRQWWVGQRTDKGRNGRLGEGAAPWSRQEGDTAEVDEERVKSMMAERDEARAVRDYATADAIRDQLQETLGVAVDDDMRQWWVGERTDKGAQGGGRGGGGPAWSRFDTGNAAEVDEDMVLGMLSEREAARRSRDYATADNLRDALEEEWGVVVDDDTKEWWVGKRTDNRDRKFGGRERGGRARGGRDRATDYRGGMARGSPRQFYTSGRPRNDGYGSQWNDGYGSRNDWSSRANRVQVPFSQPFVRSGGDDSPVDEATVTEILDERETARRSRDYRTADRLRDTLAQEFGVTVDDDERQWWVGDRKGNRVRKFNERRGDRPPPGTWGAGR